VYDDGMSPNKTALEASVRSILGSVEFSYDEMGPGKLAVRIPNVLSTGAASTWKDTLGPGSGGKEKLLELHNKRPHYDERTGGHVLDFGGRVTMPSIKNFQMQCDVRPLEKGANVRPRTDLSTVLMAPGSRRRHCAAVRQSFVPANGAPSAVQVPQKHVRHGRQGKAHNRSLPVAASLTRSPHSHRFKHPLSPLQGFAICLATLDTKVTDLKLYDNVSKLIKRK
jgi:hypothetical protein